jgi:hypothetical protein
MAGFWGTAFDATNQVSAYPIIEFVSDLGNPRFRAYDNGVWVDMGLPSGFSYNSYVKLEMELLPSGEISLKAGDLQYTTVNLAAYGSTRIANVILQGHNSSSGVSYDIYWDNFYFNNNGTAADDAAIGQQIKFSRRYTGSYNDGGVMELEGTTANTGKSSAKYFNPAGIAPCSALSSFTATFRWYCDPYTTVRTPGLSTIFTGTNGLPYTLVFVGTGSAAGWNTFTATASSNAWSLYGSGAPGGAVVQTLSQWLSDPTYGSIISGGIITAQGFNLGSSQRNCRVGIDWLESSILNGGARIDFAAPPVTYYVNDNSTSSDVYTTAVGSNSNAGTASAPFATIAYAISQANAGDAIKVDVGSYPENITVSKRLSISGSNANVACGSRGAESTINPSSGVPVIIASNDVSINGFEMTAPTSTYAINTSATSNLNIAFNNIHDIGTTLTNANVHAIIYTTSANANNVVIADNCFDNISSNLNIRSGSAITAGFSTDNGVLTGLVVERNSITDVYSSNAQFPNGRGAYGILINLGAGAGTGHADGAIIRNNSISNLSGHWAHAIGLEGRTPNALVQNNFVNGLFTTKTPSDAVGVMIETNDAASTVNITGNSFTNTDIAFDNRMTGVTVSAECNWYGTAIANNIASMMRGDVDYVSYLTSGGDASAAIGFQPSGSCSGIPVTITSTSSTNVACFGQNNGSITVSFTGGSAPLNISWTGGSASSVSSPYTISNLLAGTYSIVVTDANGSTASASVVITEPSAPSPASSITGNNVACKPGVAGSENFSISASANASSYVWSYSGTGSPVITGNGTTAISLSWTASNIQAGIAGTLTVTPFDNCGHQGTSSTTTIEYQISAPVQPSSISGSSKACPGDSLLTYSVSSVSRATSYSWTMPTGMVIKTGANTNTIQVAVRADFIGGNISVRATNVCGVSPARFKSLNVSMPAVPGAITGRSTGVCDAGVVGVPNSFTYSIASVASATSYLWTVPAGLSIISGQGTNAITVASTNNYSTGSITVSSVNGCGTSAARSLTVKGAPDRPDFITPSSPTVCAPSPSPVAYTSTIEFNVASYNWVVSFAGVIATPSTGKTVTVNWNTVASNQFVRVAASNSCGSSINRSLSGISVDACARIGDNSNSSISAYPNPASDNVIVEFNTERNNQYSLKMVDLTGRTVLNQSGTTEEGINKLDLNVSEMSSGLYLIVLDVNNIRETIHIVVE